MTTIVCDIGSCHGNDLGYISHAVDVAAELNLCIKLQLYGPDVAVGGNLLTSPQVFCKAVELGQARGVEVFASVWRLEDYRLLKQSGARTIKFAYSQRNNPLIPQAIVDFDIVYVSCQHLDVIDGFWQSGCKKLLCIPRYPVYEQLDFHNCFPLPFCGFSDHTLGIEQTISAIAHGATVIEKHVYFDGAYDCPDRRFAIDEQELRNLVTWTRTRRFSS